MNDTSMHARKKSAYAGRHRDIVADVDIDIDGSAPRRAAEWKRKTENGSASILPNRVPSLNMNALPAMNSLKLVSL